MAQAGPGQALATVPCCSLVFWWVPAKASCRSYLCCKFVWDRAMIFNIEHTCTRASNTVPRQQARDTTRDKISAAQEPVYHVTLGLFLDTFLLRYYGHFGDGLGRFGGSFGPGVSRDFDGGSWEACWWTQLDTQIKSYRFLPTAKGTHGWCWAQIGGMLQPTWNTLVFFRV